MIYYAVTLTTTAIVYTTVRVQAISRAAAEIKAVDAAMDGHNVDWEIQSVENENIEVDLC